MLLLVPFFFQNVPFSKFALSLQSLIQFLQIQELGTQKTHGESPHNAEMGMGLLFEHRGRDGEKESPQNVFKYRDESSQLEPG